MDMSKRAAVFLSIFVIVLGLINTSAQLGVLTTNEFVPGTGERFRQFSTPRLNNDGSIVFQAETTRPGESGIFIISQGKVQTVALTGQPTPYENTEFISLSGNPSSQQLATCSSNQIFFNALLDGAGGGSGLFYNDGSNIVGVLQEGQTVSAFTSPFGQMQYSTIRLNRKGQMAVLAKVEADTVFLISNGEFTRIAATGDAMPGGEGRMVVNAPSLNNGGMLAFAVGLQDAQDTAARMLVLYDGSQLVPLVKIGDRISSGVGEFRTFMNGFSQVPPTLNDRGQIAFTAQLSGTPGGTTDDEGVFIAEKTKTVEVARKGQLSPDGNGRFSKLLNYVALNNSGTVVFAAELTETARGFEDDSGIFMMRDGVLRTLVRKGSVVPEGDGTFTQLEVDGFFRYPMLNEANEVAFIAGVFPEDRGWDVMGLYFIDETGSIQKVFRSLDTLGSVSDVSIDSGSVLSFPDPGGTTAFNDSGDIVFIARKLGATFLCFWSKPRINRIERRGQTSISN